MKARARDFLASLSNEELGKPLGIANESRAMSDLPSVLVYDNVVHDGQMAYLRGFYHGICWQH